MKFKVLWIAGLMLAATAGQAQAAFVTITFEGSSNTIYTAPITRSGYEIKNPIGQEQHFHEITSTNYGLPSNGTGVLMNDRNTEIHVTASGLTPFSLTSVDVASSLNNQGGAALTIKGYLNNVLTGTISIGSLGSGYTGVNGLSLGTIDLLTFDGSSVTSGFGGFVIDNLTLNDAPAAPVPEPASLAMWSLGALGIVFAGRKRRQMKLAA